VNGREEAPFTLLAPTDAAFADDAKKHPKKASTCQFFTLQSQNSIADTS